MSEMHLNLGIMYAPYDQRGRIGMRVPPHATVTTSNFLRLEEGIFSK
jgi:hypothetical protein